MGETIFQRNDWVSSEERCVFVSLDFTLDTNHRCLRVCDERPGYFMASCWLLYFVAVVVFFEEPTRSGIDELKQREESMRDSTKHSSSPDEIEAPTVMLQDSQGNVEQSSNYELHHDEYDRVVKDDEQIVHSWYNRVVCCGCFRHITSAVVLCMAIIFIKRIALENIVASTSVVTKNRYSWTIKNVGTLHLVNGICVIPTSALAGWLSTFYLDRRLSIWFLAVVLFGLCFLVDITDLISHENEGYNEDRWLAVGPVKYIIGSLIAFSGIEACESFVASLMSKVVPSSLAVGTWNSGLLITVTGTVSSV